MNKLYKITQIIAFSLTGILFILGLYFMMQSPIDTSLVMSMFLNALIFFIASVASVMLKR